MRLSEDGAKWGRKAAWLMKMVILHNVISLWASGERYPVAFVVDGRTRAAKRLKDLLPLPPEHDPYNPGIFGGYPLALGRSCLEEALGRGNLLDDPGDAEAQASFWQVTLFENQLRVKLTTTANGSEEVLRENTYAIND